MEEKKKTNTGDAVRFFALFILLFIIIEVVLLAFLLISHLLPQNWKWGIPGALEDTPEETTAPKEDEDPPPTQSLPVFSGGTLPTPPTFTDQTVALGSTIASNYAALIDSQTGTVVASKNGNARFSPASMTKVMTLIVACEQLKTADLDRKLVMTQEIHDYTHTGNYLGSSAAGHDVGDEIRIKDLLYGIGVESASDCTALIVFDLCGSEEAFVRLMNQKAAQLGLNDTHFDNAIGYNSENNYTTASEMGMILSYAMQSELIKDILSVTSYRFEAYYYNEGEYSPFGFTYYSTLFRSRMETYERHSGKAFSLETATLEAGKTGYLDSSFLACQAFGDNGDRYVLILGDATGSTDGLACYYTMKDVKYLLDTYVP